MAKFSLRRYDVQARFSAIVSLASVITLVGLALVLARRLDRSEWLVNYGPPTKMAVYLSTVVTLGLSIAGFGFGLNSAGQRRNDKPQLSWIGFFVGGGVLCLLLILFAFFRIRGESIISA
jgi:hypothetical protein